MPGALPAIEEEVQFVEQKKSRFPPCMGMSPVVFQSRAPKQYHTEPNTETKAYRNEIKKRMDEAMERFRDTKAVLRTLEMAMNEGSIVRISDHPLYIHKLQVAINEARAKFDREILRIKTDLLIMGHYKCDFTPKSRNGRRLNLCPCKSKCPQKFLIHATLFVTSAEDRDFESMQHHTRKAVEYL